MKWGKKRASSSSFSHHSLISHVIPTSWLTKFKHMSINSGQKHAKVTRKGKWDSASIGSTWQANGREVAGRFHGGDGDAFWRLSFGADSVDGKKSRGVLKSVRYNSDDETEFPPSPCPSCVSNATRVNGKEDTQKFSNMASDTSKMRGLPRQVEIVTEMNAYAREKVAAIKTPRLRIEKDKKLRKAKQRVFEEKELELVGEQYEAEGIPRKAIVTNISKMALGRTTGMVEREDCKLEASDSRKDSYFSFADSRDSFLRRIEENSEADELSAENLGYEWQKLKAMKIQELRSRSEKQRKSLYISRELQRKRPKQNSKVKVYSPRIASKAEICKVKALEDMKKAKLKMKKKAKEKKPMEGFMGLESFAVVKCSFDPQKDFRDSMIEMIKKKRISQPEELEELLACYLTLNSDEYHDLIIKVFRQVWFELNQTCFNTELETVQCYYD